MPTKPKKRRPRHGSTVDGFISAKGVREEFQAAAVKAVIAWRLQQTRCRRAQ